jgi:hypothetical protein
VNFALRWLSWLSLLLALPKQLRNPGDVGGETLGDWIGAHTRALAAIGGVPRLIVPDNAKVAVIKACLNEPQVNRTYGEMAAHYGTAVLPTRPRRPRDKAKVEACVLIVERWLIGRLRDRRFYSLAELNAAIGELLKRLNEERPIRRLGLTRRQLVEELDRPALKPLPTEPYVFAEWRVRRVGMLEGSNRSRVTGIVANSARDLFEAGLNEAASVEHCLWALDQRDDLAIISSKPRSSSIANKMP